MDDFHNRDCGDIDRVQSQISEVAISTLESAITTFEGDMALVHQFVNGGTTATVVVGSGSYPTLPNVIATAQSSASSQIQALITSAQSSIHSAINSLNTGRFNETFSASAGTPTLVQHNLNTSTYLAFVMVQGEDGVFRSGADQVLIEEVDPLNSFNVTLQNNASFKVSVQANSNLA